MPKQVIDIRRITRLKVAARFLRRAQCFVFHAFRASVFAAAAGALMVAVVSQAGSLQPSASPGSTMWSLEQIASKSGSPGNFSRTFHSLEAIAGLASTTVDALGSATTTADFVFTTATTTTDWSVDTGGASVAVSLEIASSSATYEGYGSIKAAVVSAVGANNSAIIAYDPTGVWDITGYQNFTVYFRTTSLTMASYFLKFSDNQGTPATRTYTFTPRYANQWEKIIVVIDNPSSSSGTLDKTRITKILIGVTESASAIAMNFWVDVPAVSNGGVLASIESLRREILGHLGTTTAAGGDATSANQTTILSRIGTNADATTTPAAASSIFSGMKFLAQRQYKMQTFTSSGTWTWPGSHVSTVLVTLVGTGGGGGGSSGNQGGGPGAGGGAGQSIFRYPIAVSGNVTVTISGGAGGAGGGNSAPGSAGTAGGNTSFGSKTALGGGGGNGGGGGTTGGTGGGNIAAVASSAGANSNGDAFGSSGGGGGGNGTAGGGGGGAYSSGGIGNGSGGGGSSSFGQGGNGVGNVGSGTGSSGNNGGGFGSGGSGGGYSQGGSASGGPGGNGGSGLVIVEWFE